MDYMNSLPVKVFLYRLDKMFGGRVLRNRVIVPKFSSKKKFPIITSQDVLNKFNPFSCVLCNIHGRGTPCGPQMSRWKKLAKKGMFTNDEKVKKKSGEYFSNTLDPCFERLTDGLYMNMRLSLIMAGKLRFAKLWFALMNEMAWLDSGSEYTDDKLDEMSTKGLLKGWGYVQSEHEKAEPFL